MGRKGRPGSRAGAFAASISGYLAVGAMGEVALVSQAERSPSARGTEALQSCFCRPGRHSMTTGMRESWRLTCLREGKSEEKSGEKNRGGDITPMRLRRSLFFVAPATPAGPLAASPARLRSARRPQAAPGCRARGAFVLSNRVAQDTRALRADELRPRRIEGASWSQIRCRYGRSVGRGCARVAPPKTAARTAAPACLSGRQAAQSMLPCSLLPGIARNCSARGGG